MDLQEHIASSGTAERRSDAALAPGCRLRLLFAGAACAGHGKPMGGEEVGRSGTHFAWNLCLDANEGYLWIQLFLFLSNLIGIVKYVFWLVVQMFVIFNPFNWMLNQIDYV